MDNLISKDEFMRSSVVYIGYLILKELNRRKDKKLPLYEIYDALKKERISHYRQIVFSLMFLHACGAIEFREPFIFKL